MLRSKKTIMKFIVLILLIIFCSSIIIAQEQPGLLFISGPQSPLFDGAGEVGAAALMQDPGRILF